MNYKDAYAEHGPAIKRAFTYKALNRLIQGSAADQTKAAMVELHKEGIIPLIQVHDELDISVPDETTAQRIKEVMETCVQMQIPSLVDAEFGPSWGEAKKNFSDKPWMRGINDGQTRMQDNTEH